MALRTAQIDHVPDNDVTNAAEKLAVVFQRVAGVPDTDLDGFLFLGWLLALFDPEHFPKGSLAVRLLNVAPDRAGFRRFIRPFVKAAPWGPRHADVTRALEAAEHAFA